MKSIDEQLRIIGKGVSEIISVDDLKEKLINSQKTGKPLTVKLGLDPSAPDIHLGHTVVLRKIKQLQDLGHRAVIIIGDFTGKIGDPTGRSKTRKQLTDEEVMKNAETYKEQIFKILDLDKTEVVFNSQWLSKLNFEDIIRLAAKTTVARILEREDFKNRCLANEPIGVHEFFYPLMQGYDSIELKADIELGGNDQRFNILMGRTLQKDYGQESQIAIFMPLLEGLDGVEKMSKSLGNYIGIDEPANVMFEKAMSIPDNMIVKYYELVTDVHPDKIDDITCELEAGIVNPRDIKMELAREITTLYHGEEATLLAEEHFKTVFQKKEVPDDVPVIEVDKANFDNKTVGSLLVNNGFVASNSEFRRLVTQGGVKINGDRVGDVNSIIISSGDVMQIGKKTFVEFRIIG